VQRFAVICPLFQKSHPLAATYVHVGSGRSAWFATYADRQQGVQTFG
jgi:hypothetical protein